jgi:hypothetical protein
VVVALLASLATVPFAATGVSCVFLDGFRVVAEKLNFEEFFFLFTLMIF